MRLLFSLCFLLLLALIIACGDDDAPDADASIDVSIDTSLDGSRDALDAGDGSLSPTWSADLLFGTFGSPRLIDGELLIGFGREGSFGGAVSLDPGDGEELARYAAGQEFFTVPLIIARPGASSLHVLGGRNGWLYAIDSATRTEAWRHRPFGRDAREVGIYNFYTGLVVADQDDDGIDDILVPNGGDAERGPGSERPPGWLLVVSGASGVELSRVPIPEARETYMSLVRWERPDGTYVLFGSGGETHAGELHLVREDEVVAGSLTDAQVLVTHVSERGMVGPPSLADIDDDGTLDVICAPFDARLVAISGATLETLWTIPRDGRETNNSPAIGDFDGDGDLDIAHITHGGVFPAWSGSTVAVFDAATGNMLYERTYDPLLILTSPLAIDHDGDGRDELLFVASDPSFFMGAAGGVVVTSLDIGDAEPRVLYEADGLSASAGWAGDADDDGNAEWFVPTNHAGGGRVLRFALGTSPERVSWGGYLGTAHDAAFRR